MEIAECQARVDATKRKITELRQALEDGKAQIVRAVGSALVRWYEERARETIKEQYEFFGRLGPEGMRALKERFLAFTQATGEIVARTLADSSFWDGSPGAAPVRKSPRAPAVHYPFEPETRLLPSETVTGLFGRLADFFRANEVKPGIALAQASVREQNFPQVKAFRCAPGILEGIQKYIELRAQYLEQTHSLSIFEYDLSRAIARDKELQVKRRIEEAQRAALECWDTAISRAFPGDIDWAAAHDEAREGWRDLHDWDNRYLQWLQTTRPPEGGDTFRVFLKVTGTIERHARHYRKAHRTGIVKSLLRPTRKPEWEPWMEPLVEEQAARLDPTKDYDRYGKVLIHVRTHLCRTCSRCLDVEGCFYCSASKQSCECSEQPDVPEVDDEAG